MGSIRLNTLNEGLVSTSDINENAIIADIEETGSFDVGISLNADEVLLLMFGNLSGKPTINISGSSTIYINNAEYIGEMQLDHDKWYEITSGAPFDVKLLPNITMHYKIKILRKERVNHETN